MSKGRDFRGPKKRGFDDDGPSPYEPPRQSRTPPFEFWRSRRRRARFAAPDQWSQH